MANPPSIHYWLAGDEMNAERLNEIKDQIDFLRNPPTVHVARLNSAQTLTNGGWTIVSFDTVVNSYDPYDMWDVSDPTAVYATVPGWYVCQGQFSLAQSSSDIRLILGVFRNGSSSSTDLEMRSDVQNAPGAGSHVWTKEFHVYMNEGDWVHLGIGIETDAAAHTTVQTGLSDCCRMRLRLVSK